MFAKHTEHQHFYLVDANIHQEITHAKAHHVNNLYQHTDTASTKVVKPYSWQDYFDLKLHIIYINNEDEGIVATSTMVNRADRKHRPIGFIQIEQNQNSNVARTHERTE